MKVGGRRLTTQGNPQPPQGVRGFRLFQRRRATLGAMRRTYALALLLLASCAGAPVDSAEPLPAQADPSPWAAWDLAQEGTAQTAQALTTCPAGQTLFTATATGDAQVAEASPSTNYAANTASVVGGASPSRRRFFLGFSLPAGTIHSAELSVTQHGSVTSPAGTLDLALPSTAWTEASITWATQPAYGSPIASAATSGVPGSASVFGFGPPPLAPIAPIAAMVAGPNYGFVVDKQASVSGNLYTREFGTVASRPTLTLCYTPAPPAGCADGVKNGLETDVDCGGGTCAACANGKACTVATDCASSTCGATSTCSAAVTYTAPSTVTTTRVDVQYGPTVGETLSYWLPPGTAPVGGWPVMIGVPGGGFTGLPGGGRLASAFVYWASVLNAEGVALVTADYLVTTSTTNQFPAAVNDMRTVACWLSANGSTIGVDPARAGWAGFSAGANLVGIFATTLNTNTLPNGTALATSTCTLAGSVKFWSAYYGNVGMVPAEWSASNPNEWYYLGVSPVGSALPAGIVADATVTCDASTPPAFFTDGSSDSTVSPVAVARIAKQCRKVTPTIHNVIATGIHGYGPWQAGPVIYQDATMRLNALVLGL